MSAILQATIDSFEDMTEGQTVLLAFSATWCGPCYAMAPVLERISRETGMTLVKVDVDEEPVLTEFFEVQGVPTMILLDDGDPVKTVMGAHSKQALMGMFGL